MLTKQISIAEAVEDPTWFPHSFDEAFNHLKFIRMPVESLRSTPFLDERYLEGVTGQVTFPVDELLNHLPAALPTPPPAIFHSAFCCSTLLARSLDRPGTCVSLKEPNILMSLANAKRMLPRQGAGPKSYPQRFALVSYLLGRPFRDGEQVLLKPTNAANNLLDDWVESGAPMMLMHSSLEDFLLSVIKKGEKCRTFIRTLYNVFTLDSTGLSRIPGRQAMTLTDMQVTALIWRHQLEGFAFARQKTQGRMVSLTDKRFLDAPLEALETAVQALGLPHHREDIEATLDEGVMSRDVKDESQPLDPAKRRQTAAALRADHQETLDQILGWARTIRLDGDILEAA